MDVIVGNTLISTFYSIEPFMPAALAFSPSKIILLIDAEPKPELVKNVELVKKTLGSAVFVKTVPVEQYDLYDVAKKVVKLIDEEHGADQRVFLNVTGGRRTVTLGALMASYMRSEMVEKVVYCVEESSEFVELPKLSMTPSRAKREILEAIAKGKKPVPEIADKLEKTRGMVYAHLRELKAAGFVNEKFELTTAGRIALL